MTGLGQTARRVRVSDFGISDLGLQGGRSSGLRVEGFAMQGSTA